MPFTKNFPTSFVLRGVHEIAQFLGVSDSTIRRWILRQHLPVGKLPDGRWATTPTLIDAWILYRGPSLMESDYIYKVLSRRFPAGLAGPSEGPPWATSPRATPVEVALSELPSETVAPKD